MARGVRRLPDGGTSSSGAVQSGRHRPCGLGTPRDLQAIERIVGEEIPPVLDYLESQVPREGFLFGALGIADIAIASFLRNAAFARYRIEPERWPVAAAFVDRVLGQDCFTKLQPYESVMLRTRIPGQRAALDAAGAPLPTETVGGDVPRRRVMRT